MQRKRLSRSTSIGCITTVLAMLTLPLLAQPAARSSVAPPSWHQILAAWLEGVWEATLWGESNIGPVGEPNGVFGNNVSGGEPNIGPYGNPHGRNGNNSSVGEPNIGPYGEPNG